MDVLFFYTDRFPFGKGEAFIENEIPFLAERFDKIFIIPTALTADVSLQRALPPKFTVLPPANTDNLYAHGRPTTWQRILWSLRYMLPWCILSFFTKDFWSEAWHLRKTGQLRGNTIAAVIRVIAPSIRNQRHFRKALSSFDFPSENNYYLYSYWFNNYPSDFQKATGIKCSSLKISIMRAHGIDLYAERHACGYIPLREKSFNALDKLVLISDDGYNYITQHYPQNKEKCAVSRLGTEDYGVGPESDRKPFVLVSCSYVIPVKRVHRIVDALSQIRNHRIHWIHFGAGQDFESIKQYASSVLGNSEEITFDFKGQFLNKDLMNYYKTHEVSLFVNVSESEGLPVSIMEAISFGIPAVATNVGGTSEAFADSSDGALLDKEFRDEDLSSQIERFCEMSDEAYLQKRKEARRLWEKRFNASFNYQQFVFTYFK